MRRWTHLWARLGPLLAMGAGCSAAPPESCRAYLACFAEPDGPYGDDPRYAPLVAADDGLDLSARLHAAYGEGGECWRLGPDDPLWRLCHEACLAVIHASCSAYRAGEPDGFCVQGPVSSPRFASGGDTLSCDEAEERLKPDELAEERP